MYFLYIRLKTVMLHSKPKYTAVHKQSFTTLSLTRTHCTHLEVQTVCTAKKVIFTRVPMTSIYEFKSCWESTEIVY